jgi:hypothetical protein
MRRPGETGAFALVRDTVPEAGEILTVTIDVARIRDIIIVAVATVQAGSAIHRTIPQIAPVGDTIGLAILACGCRDIATIRDAIRLAVFAGFLRDVARVGDPVIVTVGIAVGFAIIWPTWCAAP